MMTARSWAWRAALLLAGACSLLAVAPPRAEDGTPLAQEIDAMHARYLAAFNHRDAASVAALFTEDGVFIDPAGSITAGRVAVARVGDAKGRLRRIMITALARKLLAALWGYATQRIVPEGAVFKA
jgi:hypothetical protein